MSRIIEPSLLALDKNKEKVLLRKIKDLKLKYVHYDVMDDEFIGHKALMGEYLDTLEELGILPNIHLMVADPKKYIKLFSAVKANSIVFHVETQSIRKTKRLLRLIRRFGFKAGIAIKKETDLLDYADLAPKLDFILIMSVTPGLGGQMYSDECKHNLKVANQMKQVNHNITIQLDGGVDDKIMEKNKKLVDNFITGTWFFNNIKRAKTFINWLKK